MAITSQERIGKAMELLHQGLAPFLEREVPAVARHRGLRVGQVVAVDTESAALLVKADAARRGLEAEVRSAVPTTAVVTATTGDGPSVASTTSLLPVPQLEVRRVHGVALLDPTRVGRDASRITDQLISHLGAEVTVTLEIETSIDAGVPDNVLRTVTENSRTLKFT